MSDETEENVIKIVLTNVASTSHHVSGNSNNNTYHHTNNITILPSIKYKFASFSSFFINFHQCSLHFFLSRNPKLIEEKEEEHPNDETTIEDNNDQMIESIPVVKVLTNEELILNLVWKYLKYNDKLNCTLVCKSFNSFISEKDCFKLHINLRKSPINSSSKLTRYYKTVCFRECKFYNMQPIMLEMLKHLGHSLVKLCLYHVQINVIILSELLDQLPWLESIEFFHIQFKETDSSSKCLPQFLHLKQLRARNVQNVEKMFPIFKNAKCIQTLVLNYAQEKLNVKELNTFFIQHKSSLKSLRIDNYQNNNDLIKSKSNLNIDCLHQLRELTLFNCKDITTKVLSYECVAGWLTDLKINYIFKEMEEINFFLLNYFMEKVANELLLTKYKEENFQKPIIVKTKCPISGKVVTKFYLVHHCIEGFRPLHSTCNFISSINTQSYLRDNENKRVNLFIHVRDNFNDFETIRDYYLVNFRH